MTYLLFYILFLVSISVAATAALLSDIFFFISIRHRRIDKEEYKQLRSFMGISSIASIFAAISLISLFSIRIGQGFVPQDFLLITVAIILIIAFGSSLTLRNFHLPALHRHQHEYHHLSESMSDHQNSLLATSVTSFVSWLYIVTLLSADSRGIIETTHFLEIIISYFVVSYVLSKLVIFTKKSLK